MLPIIATKMLGLDWSAGFSITSRSSGCTWKRRDSSVPIAHILLWQGLLILEWVKLEVPWTGVLKPWVGSLSTDAACDSPPRQSPACVLVLRWKEQTAQLVVA